MEIICVNDCSPDNSLKILKEYAQNDKRIKIIDLPENKGQGYARNIAIDVANGEYIMFLDPDDFLVPDACEKAYNQIKENDNDFVVFNYYRYYEEKNEYIADTKFSDLFKDFQGQNSILVEDCSLQLFLNAYSWIKIYKASFIKNNNIKFSTYRFLEDSLFIVNLLIAAKDFSFIPLPLYVYRKKANQEMTIDYTKFYSQLVQAHKDNYLLLKNSNRKFLKQNYVAYTINSVIHWYKTFTSINPSISEDFFNVVREYFCMLNNENDISLIKKMINFKMFSIIIRNQNYKNYQKVQNRRKILKQIFSLSNKDKHKIITFFGMEIKIKRRFK